MKNLQFHAIFRTIFARRAKVKFPTLRSGGCQYKEVGWFQYEKYPAFNPQPLLAPLHPFSSINHNCRFFKKFLISEAQYPISVRATRRLVIPQSEQEPCALGLSLPGLPGKIWAPNLPRMTKLGWLKLCPLTSLSLGSLLQSRLRS